MGPTTFPKRRRRDEDDAKSRPKKKFKKVKQQKAYHSSSEDDSDGEDANTRGSAKFRARDAPLEPTPRPEEKKKATSKKGASTRQDRVAADLADIKATTKPTPNARSILKAAPTDSSRKRQGPQDEEDASEDEEEESMDELEVNTALNAIATDDLDADEPENLSDLELDDDEPDLNSLASSDEESDDQSETNSTASGHLARTKKKRNDPDAFATSISKILDTKLSTAKRSDPVLSRSKSAQEANRAIADEKLEQKARAQIRAEKKIASERGRVRDVLGLKTPDVDTGAIVELEKRLKKTAQRGVVKLFNAVRAAQVKGEEAMRQAKSAGVVGMQQREEKASEMSKQGFLDLISSGGKKMPPAVAA